MARRFRPLRTWRFWAGWVVVILVALRAIYLLQFDEPPAAVPEGEYTVSMVIDGDTLSLEDGRRVRLIGVDAPEMHYGKGPPEPWAAEADAFARQWVDRSKGVVRLEFDEVQLDKYGRCLAYVWTDGKLLNEELVRAGLARFLPHFHYAESMKRRFRLAEREAKKRGLGMWSRKPETTPAGERR